MPFIAGRAPDPCQGLYEGLIWALAMGRARARAAMRLHLPPLPPAVLGHSLWHPCLAVWSHRDWQTLQYLCYVNASRSQGHWVQADCCYLHSH